ncbi:MAG: hypothetical protein ETSY1_10595 [Candidatus Entotheonella factor]|uniref:Type II secretion system protein H n=1 Tax=Entotheonella factor TaxID=1429438 RepID=W4LT54_ENTF1|nr:GspH/FimT family protein [Candidatus Entotheonella palauensis]ETX00617.1 MAG: hypothetical protein ETSY1_10595 [Candidatus Entotheonella factor]
MYPYDDDHGATLFELILATAVLGLMAQLGATVSLDLMPRYRLQGATQQLAWDLMRARRQAVKQNQSMTILFPDAHTYTIWDDDNANGAIDVTETVDRTVDIHDTAPGVSVTTGAPFPISVVYTSRGVPLAPATFSVANGSGVKNVEIRITGNVDIP